MNKPNETERLLSELASILSDMKGLEFKISKMNHVVVEDTVDKGEGRCYIEVNDSEQPILDHIQQQLDKNIEYNSYKLDRLIEQMGKRIGSLHANLNIAERLKVYISNLSEKGDEHGS